MPKRDLYAAADLGSNSFHLIVARREHGELRIIDQIKEMIRLAGGVDRKGHLDAKTEREALACLARFSERLRGLPETHVRTVGTQTFRRLLHAERFHTEAEAALGCPIEVISGREEARLVYRGVWAGMAKPETPKLIIDVGGGSTEVVVGEGEQPELAESLPFGCVGMTLKMFEGGKMTQKRWQRGKNKIMADAQWLAAQLKSCHWAEAIGSSGTARALVSISDALNPEKPSGLTRQSMEDIRDRLIQAGHVDAIDLPGLSERRQPVIAGGALIFDALMSAFEIEALSASTFALREGVLHDLMDRLYPTTERFNPRTNTIEAMLERYQCDRQQARRVTEWALAGFDQVAKAWNLSPLSRELLACACQLHEVGLSIAHEQYQEHSGYILGHADMPGFSHNEQRVMALLATAQRGKPRADLLSALPSRLQTTALRLLMLTRVAVALSRPRNDDCPNHIQWHVEGQLLTLGIPHTWLGDHPLTERDLVVESEQIKRLDAELAIERLAQ